MPFDVTLPELFKWLAMGFTLIGAGMTAADLGRRFTGWGFAALATSSVFWLASAQLEQESQLGLTNLVLLALNLFGVWRWLVRKAPGGAEAPRRGPQPAE
jgi:membrane protein implicated in regulation of membrane protease activity